MPNGRESEALAPLLRDFGVNSKGALVVHSAIGRLSRQGFKAESMIETFLRYMEGGHLFMPTMTWRTVLPANPVWDEMATPSHTGVMSEIFRTRYATARSIHPTHSVAGLGPAAKMLLSRHHIDATPVSQNSPYGLLRDYDTTVLTIGCGLETVTAIHLPEETIAADLYVRPHDAGAMYQCTDRHGTVHQVWARRHWSLSRDFPKFAPALAARGELKCGDILGCPYIIVSMRALLRDVFAALIANPRGTLSAQAMAGDKT